jgi:hypothetical protein
MPCDVRWSQGGKGERGTFWQGTLIDIDTRLRIGGTMGKSEEEVAAALMARLQARGHQDVPPAIATDGQGSYHLGRVLEGRPPTRKQA